LDHGRLVWLAWQGARTFDADYEFEGTERTAELIDPLTGETGRVPLAAPSDRRRALRLVLEPGQSVLMRLVDDLDGLPEWRWRRLGEIAQRLDSEWRVEFLEGGPARPASFHTRRLESWAHRGDVAAEAFSGTACYRIEFDVQPLETQSRTVSNPWTEREWLLDLGDVRHVARARLNGRDLGARVQRPYRWTIPAGLLRAAGNRLEVEVTNLAANRIRDLDRRGVQWRIFHDINFVNIRYRPFDASGWPTMPSGLLGPAAIVGTR